MSDALPNKILSGDSKVTIPAGDIQFYDRFSPPLETGAYTLEAQQTVQKVDSGEDVKFPADAPLSKPFRVDGPRFNLPGTYIHQQYPPANHIGGFANDLPNIVFRNARALPWQRSVVDFSKTPDWSLPPQGTPWMALLTFRDSELQAGGPVGKPVSTTVPDLLQSAANVLVPQINPTLKQKEEMARVMTVDYEFFKAVCPQQGEMHYLAHGREVDTAGKVILGVEGTGFFSLVVGNRAVKEGQENTLVLISLEGHWERLAGGSDTDHPGAHIRLVVLASWQATAIESPGDFLVLLEQLSERDGGLSLYRLPAAGDTDRTGDPSCDPKAQAREVVELGMVPMPNDLRIGEKTTSVLSRPVRGGAHGAGFHLRTVPLLRRDHSLRPGIRDLKSLLRGRVSNRPPACAFRFGLRPGGLPMAQGLLLQADAQRCGDQRGARGGQPCGFECGCRGGCRTRIRRSCNGLPGWPARPFGPHRRQVLARFDWHQVAL